MIIVLIFEGRIKIGKMCIIATKKQNKIKQTNKRGCLRREQTGNQNQYIEEGQTKQ
jgi:hypothetical protein